MMVAGLSLPFLTKFSDLGVEIELVSSSSGQKPEGPVGHISFYEKVRCAGQFSSASGRRFPAESHCSSQG
jgi:hypothetical protein